MDNFDTKYYKLNKVLLSAVGLWPYQEARQYYIRRTIAFVTILSLSTAVASAFLKADWSLDLFAETLPLCIMLFIALLKYFVWSYHKQKMQVLLETITQDWNCVKSMEEYMILHGISDEGRLYNMYCARFLYIISFLFNFSPLTSIILDVLRPLNQSRSLEHPYKADYYVDPQQHYYPILFHMYFGSTVILTVILATDLTYISKLHHACGLFRLAGFQINAALTWKSDEHFFEDSNYIGHENFANGVKCHERAMKFTAGINDFYKWLNFVSLILVVISVSISLFCAAAFIDRWKDMIANLICAIGQIVYIFVAMYPGQRLINDSGDVREKTYSTHWYSAPISTQKLMIIVMQKCLTPSKICAGKIIAFSMESYSAIIQTSISYFMALLSMR